MDSRNKILAPQAAAKRLQLLGPSTVVSGYFDPLLPAHGRRLESVREAGTPLVVVVLDPPSPLMPAQARAELLAALACVDTVILPDGSPLPEPSIRFESRDAEDAEAFSAVVRARQD